MDPLSLDLELYEAMCREPEGIFVLKPEAVVDLRWHIEGYHRHWLQEGITADAMPPSLGHRAST